VVAIDVSAGKKDFRRQANGFAEIAGDGGQCREEKVAEAMSFKTRSLYEPVLKQTGEQGFIFREGDDAVADISGRKHVELFAETSTGAAVVADCNHGAQFANLRLARFLDPAETGDVTLKSLE
jgi:hypothetical protein